MEDDLHVAVLGFHFVPETFGTNVPQEYVPQTYVFVHVPGGEKRLSFHTSTLSRAHPRFWGRIPQGEWEAFKQAVGVSSCEFLFSLLYHSFVFCFGWRVCKG